MYSNSFIKVLVRLMGFLCDYLPINKKIKKKVFFFLEKLQL